MIIIYKVEKFSQSITPKIHSTLSIQYRVSN